MRQVWRVGGKIANAKYMFAVPSVPLEGLKKEKSKVVE